MSSLKGYHLLEQIYLGEKIVVHRALREADNHIVVLKMLRESHPDQADIAKLTFEYNIGKNLKIPEVIEIHGFEKIEGRYALVLNDFPNSLTLAAYLQKNKLTILQFLNLSIQLAHAVMKLHDAHIIHKDITPNNILITKDGKNIKILDFSNSTKLKEEEHEVISPDKLEGSLPYISPEQTTRMNRPLDRRSDLYSLGIVFYEMITGFLPFEAIDANEWVYNHIARRPRPPHEVSPDIPKQISNIIMKLVAKSPDDRYGTAYGLKQDLQHCLKFYSESEEVPSFDLGKEDRIETFHLSQKLYGREKQLAELSVACERINNYGKEVYLLSGPSGIGKSSLVNELQKNMVQQKINFAYGKYEKHQGDIPYSAFILALRDLVKKVLHENMKEIENIRTDILKALGRNGQIITNVIPELKKIIGEQPDLGVLTTNEETNLFELTIIDFLKVFAKKGKPLVIILDDLQWADNESFKLIKQVLVDTKLDYLLMIGTYRESEVTNNHPLLAAVKFLQDKKITINEMHIKPLTNQEVSLLIRDTLGKVMNLAELTELISEKSLGNPYYVNLFLSTLYKSGHLKYNSSTGAWEINLEAVKLQPIAENVANLIISEVGKLSDNTQNALKTAACLGNQFSLSMLAKMLNLSASETANLIWPALEEKWLIPVSGDYRLVSTDHDLQEDIVYRFSHDRVLYTLYSSLEDYIRKQIHYRISQILLSSSSKDQEDSLFDIIHHLSECLDIIFDKSERLQAGVLFSKAAHKTKFSAAYDTATTLFIQADKLLGEQIWVTDYDMALTMHLEYATCLYLTGSFDQAVQHFKTILNTRANTAFDKAKTALYLSTCYASRSMFNQSIDSLEKGLAKLKVKIPKHGLGLKVFLLFLKIRKRLKNKTTDDLYNFPLVKSERIKLVMNLLSRLSVYTFVNVPYNQRKLVYVNLLNFMYTLQHGNSPTSPSSYMSYALMMTTMGNYDKGLEYGLFALKLSEKLTNPYQISEGYINVVSRIFSFKLPYAECLEYTIKSQLLCRTSGNLLGYQYSSIVIFSFMFFSGYPISELLKKLSDFLADDFIIRNENVSAMLKIFKQMMEILHGDRPKEEFRKIIQHNPFNNPTDIMSLTLSYSRLLNALQVAYLLEDWEVALELIEKLRVTLDTKRFNRSLIMPSYAYLSGLTLLKMYPKATWLQKWRYWFQLKRIIKQFKVWTKNNPTNFQTQYSILKAGLIELTNPIEDALPYYEKAVEISEKHSFLHKIAGVHEFMGQCYLKRKQLRNAKSYFQDALAVYNQWEAHAKVDLLLNHYANLVTPNIQGKATSSISSIITSQSIDLNTILKSVQTISSHIKLNDLLETLLKILLESAGAERGYIILKEQGQLIIEAAGMIDQPYKVLQNEPIDTHTDFCYSVVQHVQTFHEAVIINNAIEDETYANDAYVRKFKPLSILCVPIMHQQHLIGILYLENNILQNAFNQKHLEILKVLSSQIAISLENSKLYSAYDQFIPHQFLDMLGKHSIVDISLGNYTKKNMSVLFTDIRSFSTISEQLPPAEVLNFINTYLSYMEPMISIHGGFIDKFIGDAIMALFPSADAAVLAGIAMQKQLVKYNKYRSEMGLSPVKMGIGINTGNLILGTLGGPGRLETSALGDAVNVAERIQELTKEYHSQLLIGNNTYEALRHPEKFLMRSIGLPQIRGREEKIGVWEVFNADNENTQQIKQAIAVTYNQAMQKFMHKNYSNALLLFEKCLENLPDDEVIKMHIADCKNILGNEKKKFIPMDNES